MVQRGHGKRDRVKETDPGWRGGIKKPLKRKHKG